VKYLRNTSTFIQSFKKDTNPILKQNYIMVIPIMIANNDYTNKDPPNNESTKL